jgi:hypothetical protein
MWLQLVKIIFFTGRRVLVIWQSVTRKLCSSWLGITTTNMCKQVQKYYTAVPRINLTRKITIWRWKKRNHMSRWKPWFVLLNHSSWMTWYPYGVKKGNKIGAYSQRDKVQKGDTINMTSHAEAINLCVQFYFVWPCAIAEVGCTIGVSLIMIYHPLSKIKVFSERFSVLCFTLGIHIWSSCHHLVRNGNHHVMIDHCTTMVRQCSAPCIFQSHLPVGIRPYITTLC